MTRVLLLLVVLAVVLFSAAALATETTFGVQGRILDGGTPAEGDIDAVFRIFNDPTAGSLLWEENQTISLDSNGIFSAVLGANGSAIRLNFSETYWLELVLGGEVESPRMRIAMSLQAASAQSLTWPNATAYGDVLPFSNGSVALGGPGLEWSNVYVSNDITAAGIALLARLNANNQTLAAVIASLSARVTSLETGGNGSGSNDTFYWNVATDSGFDNGSTFYWW